MGALTKICQTFFTPRDREGEWILQKMLEQNYNLRASTVQPDSSFALIAKNTSLVEGDGRLFQWCLIYQAQMWSTGIWEVCKL